MVKQERKYGVVISDNDQGYLRIIMESLQDFGAQIKGSGNIVHISGWIKANVTPQNGSHIGELVAIADNLDIHFINGKQRTAEYVGRHPNDIDLVLMNRSNMHSRSDIDGFEAAQYMRDHGYQRWIALQTQFLIDEHRAKAEYSGVNDIFQKGIDSESVFNYIVQRYRTDRKP